MKPSGQHWCDPTGLHFWDILTGRTHGCLQFTGQLSSSWHRMDVSSRRSFSSGSVWCNASLYRRDDRPLSLRLMMWFMCTARQGNDFKEDQHTIWMCGIIETQYRAYTVLKAAEPLYPDYVLPSMYSPIQGNVVFPRTGELRSLLIWEMNGAKRDRETEGGGLKRKDENWWK